MWNQSVGKKKLRPIPHRFTIQDNILDYVILNVVKSAFYRLPYAAFGGWDIRPIAIIE